MSRKGSEKSRLMFAFFIFALGQLAACSGGSGDSPKEVVIKLFGAMERDDRDAIPYLIDLPAMMNVRGEDYALQTDSPRVFHNPMDVLDDMTGTGLTKTRWFSMQRVVGKTDIAGDTAFVEVSFINKKTGIQYYNRFGLHKASGRWQIYSFKTAARNK